MKIPTSSSSEAALLAFTVDPRGLLVVIRCLKADEAVPGSEWPDTADEKRLHLGSIPGCSHNQDRQLVPGCPFSLYHHIEGTHLGYLCSWLPRLTLWSGCPTKKQICARAFTITNQQPYRRDVAHSSEWKLELDKLNLALGGNS
ncbi:hypothetical protein llap_16454 [Limosa lapponica baueri]|uniref:Uncharacterized protein n=1 Tax=Limosa lapponica baueri TaxID=1758121 RepID=A0A2I0THM8_LIMLA|nr:hypothetical protein llap_16454 [Limosa lapponica baueri]